MTSWIFHRLTGVGVLLFLAIHIVDTFTIAFGPEVYDTILGWYHIPIMRIPQTILIAAVLYHALNGVRVILIDFWPGGTRYQEWLFRIVLILFVGLMVPAAYFTLRPLF